MAQKGSTFWQPSNIIRNKITKWEGSTMATNASMGAKAREVASITPNWNTFTPAQKDSLFSYYYSVSPNTYQSTIVPLAQQVGTDDNAIQNIADNMTAGASRFRGLKIRRNEEQQMFLHGYQLQQYKPPIDVTTLGKPEIINDIK